MILALKALALLVISFLIMALALFLAAGTIAWPAGWICLILLFGWLLVGIGLLLKYNPGLLEERLSLSQTNQKAWDKVFLLLYELFLFAWLVLMPLDAVRFHWSQMPLLLQVRRGHSSGGIVPSHLPDLSRKLVLVANRAYSARAGTNGGIHWTISLCATSSLCQRSPPLSRDVPAAGVLVRLAAGPGHDTRGRGASRPGGTRVAQGIARL